MDSGRSAGRAPWPDFVADFVRKNSAWLAELGFIPSHHTPIRASFHHPGKGILLTAAWDPWDVWMDLGLGPPLARPEQKIIAYPLHLYSTALQGRRWDRKFKRAARDPTFSALRLLLKELLPLYDEALPKVARAWKERTETPAGREPPNASVPDLAPELPSKMRRRASALTPWERLGRLFKSPTRRDAVVLTISYGLVFGLISAWTARNQWLEHPRMKSLKESGTQVMGRVQARRFGPYRQSWSEAEAVLPDGRPAALVSVYGRHEIGAMVPLLCDAAGCVEAEKVDLHVRWWPFTPRAILSYLGLLGWMLVALIAQRFRGSGKEK